MNREQTEAPASERAKLIKSFVLNNPHLVDVKDTHIPELKLLKYKKKVFYDNLWTPELLECRGTIIDQDFNVVSRPFTKVFNYGENGTKIDRDTMCTYVRKVNGFLCAVSLYNGEILISTTGSTTSKFVDIARKHLEPYLSEIHSDMESREYEGYGTRTYIFEIVDRDDPHIVEEQEGAYLIGCRYNSWAGYQVTEGTLDIYAQSLGCKRPEWKKARFSDILQEVKTVKHEGFMVYGKDGTNLKIKSPYYLSKKALMRMGTKQIDVMFDKPDVFRNRLDEEFHKIHSEIISKVTKIEWARLTEQGRRDIFESYFEQKGAFQ